MDKDLTHGDIEVYDSVGDQRLAQAFRQVDVEVRRSR
jgi:hypothetical protein